MDENEITVPDLSQLSADEWNRVAEQMRRDIERFNTAH